MMKVRFSQPLTNFCCLILLVSLIACHSSKKTSNSLPDKENNQVEEKDTRKEKTKQLLNTASSFKGTNYKAGGTTKSGMDCSGLVFSSFQEIDLKLPRTSKEQSKIGAEINKAEAQPGDLIFFSTDGKSKGINHVGIITSVISEKDLVFIHSTLRGGVMENRLSEPYYQKTFEKIMRVY